MSGEIPHKLEETILSLIEKRGARTADARRAVYAQIRAAFLKTAADRNQPAALVDRKLQALELTTAAIERRLVSRSRLDDADGVEVVLGPEETLAPASQFGGEEPPVSGNIPAEGRSVARMVGLLAAATAVVGAAFLAWDNNVIPEFVRTPLEAARPVPTLPVAADFPGDIAQFAELIASGTAASALRTQIGNAVARRGAEPVQAFLAKGYASLPAPARETLHYEVARAAYEHHGADWAAYNLALDLVSGYGVRKNVDEAAELLEKLVSKGHAGAEHYLARLLLDDTYHGYDRDRAISLLESASGKGYAASKTLLASVR